MDISTLKEKIDEAEFTELETFIKDLTGQRDAARKESIEKRQGLKTRVSELETLQADLFERLGISSVDDLDDLDPKGQAEAAKQFEARVKRLERDLDAKVKAFSELEDRHRGTLQDVAMRKAMSTHEFVDADLVAAYVTPRLVWEDDAVMYKTDTGVVSLDEGLTVLAKEKPHLVKASGAGGSGYRGGNGAGGAQVNPWKKETRNLTEQARLSRENPQLAANLKAQAAQ